MKLPVISNFKPGDLVEGLEMDIYFGVGWSVQGLLIEHCAGGGVSIILERGTNSFHEVQTRTLKIISTAH
jgi:hypothetical protein